MTDKYLISNVSSDEYTRLREAKQSIIAELVKSFNNNQYQERAKQINVSFKYNPKTGTVGIFLRKGNEERVVLNEDEAGLDDIEKDMVVCLHQNLEDKIRMLRTKEGRWIE